jgi:glutamate dehydrogenase/leucine dehydrogenase
VKVDKLTGTDGFIVYDLADATTSVGVVRLAPKVLRDGAELLARSVTYAFASFGVAGHGGASGAVNAKPEARDDAVAAFVDEVRERAGAGSLALAPGTGLTEADLAPLGWTAPDPALVAAGALAAARVAGPTDWRTAAVAGPGPVAEAAVAQLAEAGATVVDGRVDAPCDVLFVAGKAGVLDHHAAATVEARTVVPLTPVAVTARALAVLRKGDRVVIPDFLSTAAPLLATYDAAGGDPVRRIHAAVTDLADHGTGLWLAAALRAEENLAAWTAEKPFGRPLA